MEIVSCVLFAVGLYVLKVIKGL